MAVLAIADVYGISGRRGELVELLARTQETARATAGARRYDFTEIVGEADHFVLVSEWESREALDAYHRSEAFSRYQLALNGLLARPSEMTVYTVSEAVRPQPSGVMDPRDAD